MSEKKYVTQNIHGTVTQGSGTSDHNRLVNRDKENQHPIKAIEGLREELDAKLDSKTALPLIQNAVNNKGAGLYYDAKKELARKAYWYVCSEIDPVTKQGTKDSIISGPYDLGQGGGSGGGGGVTKITLQLINWPTAVTVNSTSVALSINWTSTIGEEREPTGAGTLYVSVNGKQVIVQPNVAQGNVTFDVAKYIIAGSNNIQVNILDAYGTTAIKVGTINAVNLELKSNFDDSQPFNGTVRYFYTPYGGVEKTVRFIVDGNEIGQQVVKATGESQTYNITGLDHGAHKLEVYFTATISNVPVTSNTLTYDLIVYDEGNKMPIITSTFARESNKEQFIPFNIPYRIYIWDEMPPYNVELIRNDVLVKSIEVDTSLQYWEIKEQEIGIYPYTIKCTYGEGTNKKVAERTFYVTITKSEIEVNPVRTDLALELSSEGRQNSEPLNERSTWKFIDNRDPAAPVTISCEMTNFNWASNGWVKDAENNTVLRLSGDARVRIPYQPFAQDVKRTGKTIEIEFATSAIRNYSSTIISCLDGQYTDAFDGTGSFVDEDIRQYVFDVLVDPDIAKTKFTTTGSHVLNYTENGWVYNDEVINLGEFGISLRERQINVEGLEDLVLVGDNIIINYSIVAKGFYITPQIAALRSQQSNISTQYKEDDRVHLTFVIDQAMDNRRIIWMYINGIASGAVQYPVTDLFSQSEPSDIILGSNDAILDIYNIRVYDNNLSSKQVVNNWISNTQDPALRAERYYRNDNYNDEELIAISKLPAGLPYIIWDIDPLPQFKGDKRKGNGRYIDPTNAERNFTTENVEYNVQGTSSSVYPVKNIRMRPKKSDAWYNDNGDTIKKWPITYPDGIGVDYYTFKVDYASSEGANNVELVRLYNDVCRAYGILTPPQKVGSDKDKVRVGIDGFPIAAFHQDASGKPTFCTKANFNNDKSNPNVFGFADGDESWETTNNSALEAIYKRPATAETFDKAFEIRYPDEDGYSDLSKLGPMTEWVVSTDPAAATGNLLDSPISYTYTDVVVAEDNSYSTQKVTVGPFTHDTAEYRLAKFKAELHKHFNVDSTLFYYLFTHLFLMVDSRAKNAFPTYFATRTNEVDPNTGEYTDGGDRWFWLPYDMDTAIGINNEGKLVFDYSLEDIDKVNSANVFNGQDSVLWNNVRTQFKGELTKMYSELRVQNLISFEIVEGMFEEHQGKWSENIFNEDSKLKYVDPLILNGKNYLEMLQGAKAEQRKWWLYNRFRYFDSKYATGDAKKDSIIFRVYADDAAEVPNLVVTPYADIYATVVWQNGAAGTVSKRARRNEPIILESAFEPGKAVTDQEVHVLSPDQLKSIGDLSGFKVGLVDVAAAIKLQDLKIGSGALGYRNENLTSLSLGKNTLLKTLDVRNCVNLAQTVDISACINIEDIYFEGTQINGIVLPDGGNIKHLHLPPSVKNLTIRNQPLLDDLIVEPSTLEQIRIENISPNAFNNNNSLYNFIFNITTDKYLRLVGFDESYSYNQVVALYNKLDTLHGIDENNATVAKAQVSGTIHINESLSFADYNALISRYPSIKIEAADIICTVIFRDYNGEFITSRTVSKGTDLIDIPEDPVREPDVAHYWEFANWDHALTNIQEDLETAAVYTQFDQQYTVRFKPMSDIISVTPQEQTKKYGLTIDEPQLSPAPGSSEWPEDVTFSGWYKDNGEPWNFASDIPVSNMNLYAHYQDKDELEIVAFNRYNCNSIHIEATDNLGIIAYGFSSSSEEEPEVWIPIENPSIRLNENIKLDNVTGTRYFWLKDNGGHTNFRYITVYPFNKNISDGATLMVKETVGDEIVDVDPDTAIIIEGTTITISAEFDSHYSDCLFVYNGASKALDAVITATVDGTELRWINVTLSCTPTIYQVTHIFGKDDIETVIKDIPYNTPIPKPADQYYEKDREIISGWYFEQEFENRVDFEIFRVSENITIYAKWEPYNEPTKIRINIPEEDEHWENTLYNISLFVYQNDPEAVIVDWGDGSSVENSVSVAQVEFTHSYSIAGNYEVKVSKVGSKRYILGKHSDNTNNTAVIMPSKIITDVTLAYDINYTAAYAFCNTSVNQVNLNTFIKEISTCMFQDCQNITELTLPNNIVKIGQKAFYGCTNITGTLVLPESLEILEANAFDSCTKIQAVQINNKLTELRSGVFQGCLSLASLEIPSNIKNIGLAALNGCGLVSLEIPETVETIAPTSFTNNRYLEHVVLRNPNLGYNGINQTGICLGCPKLTSVGPIGRDCTLEFAWEDLPDYVFYGCNSIKTADLYCINSIGTGVFNSCLSLNNVNLTGVLSIGNEAFKNCGSLRQILIPNSVHHIGSYSFGGCTALQTIKFYPAQLDEKQNNRQTAIFTFAANHSNPTQFTGWDASTSTFIAKLYIPNDQYINDNWVETYGQFLNFVAILNSEDKAIPIHSLDELN